MTGLKRFDRWNQSQRWRERERDGELGQQDEGKEKKKKERVNVLHFLMRFIFYQHCLCLCNNCRKLAPLDTHSLCGAANFGAEFLSLLSKPTPWFPERCFPPVKKERKIFRTSPVPHRDKSHSLKSVARLHPLKFSPCFIIISAAFRYDRVLYCVAPSLLQLWNLFKNLPK